MTEQSHLAAAEQERQTLKAISDMGISGRDLAKRMRHEQIKRSLAAKPRTLNELSEILGNHYQTIYRDVRELMRSFQVYPTGDTRNGGILYRSGNSEITPPELFHIEALREVELLYILNGVLANNFAPSKAATAADTFPLLVLRYLELAAKFAEGNPITDEEVEGLRNEFVVGLNSLKVVMSFFQQFIENDGRWSIVELRRIGSLPSYQYDDLREVIEAFAKSRYFTEVEAPEIEPS